MNQNNQIEWLRVLSLKYRSTDAISTEDFDLMIAEINAILDIDIEIYEQDYIFPLLVDNVNCMCGIVLLNNDPITECQFTVMTKEKQKPQEMSKIEAIHTIIEKLFIQYT